MKKTAEPINHLPNYAYSNPEGWSGTMTRRQLKETLLYTDGLVFACGYLRDIVSEHLGAGVYRVILKKRD